MGDVVDIMSGHHEISLPDGAGDAEPPIATTDVTIRCTCNVLGWVPRNYCVFVTEREMPVHCGLWNGDVAGIVRSHRGVSVAFLLLSLSLPS